MQPTPNLARDEAGNIWEVDGQGNAVRLHQPQAAPSPTTYIAPPANSVGMQDRAFDRQQDIAAEQRAQEDQALQRAAARREEEKHAASMAQGPGGEKATEGERKGAGFYQRALSANQSFNGLDLGAPGYVGNFARSILPDDLDNLITSDDRKLGLAYQGAFIKAALRQESGAAIPPEEEAAYRKNYFPAPGDSAETIAAKAKLREDILEGLRIGAGSLAVDPLAPLPEGDTDMITVEVVGGRAPTAEEAANDPLIDDQFQGNAPTETTQQRIDAMRDSDNALSRLASGVIDTGSFGLHDEANAALDALGGALSGEGSYGDLYADNIAVERGYIDAIKNDPAYIGGQIGGAVALPFGAGARTARGMGGVAAAEGAAYGFGSGEGIEDRLGRAAIGAPLGGAVGYGIGKVAPKLSDMLRRKAPDDLDRAVVEAGRAEGIPIRQPDARPSTRADFAGVEASESGNKPVSRALEGDKTATEARLREVGGDGRVLDDYEMGQRIQSSGEKYLVKTRAQANGLYRRAEALSADATAEPTNALRVIDEQIAELTANGANTNAGQINYLNALRSDLEGGATIAKLRNMRTSARGQINERNLTQTDAERRVGLVLDGMSDDIASSLAPDALKAYRSADDFYRQRMEFKDQVLKRFLGSPNDPISPETAASRFNSFMKSRDYGRFQRMMAEMDPEDRADIAATVAEQLGQRRSGEFSYAALVSNTKKMSQRALREMFGEDGAQSIRNLRVIAAAKRDTAGALNNSRTGVVNNRLGFKDALTAIAGGSVAGIPGMVGGVALRQFSEKVGNRRLARALLNPDFTKWMKNAPATDNPQAIRGYIKRLNNVGGTQAGDVRAIQDFLFEAFDQSPGRAAAENENQGR